MYASIDSVLLKKPYLELVKADLYGIAKRIKQIDTGYFIVFNKRKGKYEVHNLKNGGWNTYCFTVPFELLDYRTIQICRETNVKIHGDEVEKRIDAENEKLKVQQDRDFKRGLDDAGVETADRVAFGIDEDELHTGYMKTHYMGGGVNNDG